jgi:hypothetical protein
VASSSLLSQVVRRRAWTAGFQSQSHLTPNVPLHHSPRPPTHQKAGNPQSPSWDGGSMHGSPAQKARRCPITPMPYHAVSRAPASTRLQAQSHTPPTATRQSRDGGRETQTGSSVTIWHPQGDVPSLVGSRAGDGTHPKIKKEEIKITRCVPLRQTSPHLGRRPGWDAVSCVLIWCHPIPQAWPSCRGKGQAPEGAD